MNDKPTPRLAVTETRLLAKVVITSGNKIEIVAVFSGSDYYKFYYVFTAKRPNASIREWEFVRSSGVRVGYIKDFEGYVNLEMTTSFAHMIKFVDRKYYCTEKELQEFTDKIAQFVAVPALIQPRKEQRTVSFRS